MLILCWLCASVDGALHEAGGIVCCVICGCSDSATTEQPIRAQLSRWQ
jgi:hypothetical protein